MVGRQTSSLGLLWDRPQQGFPMLQESVQQRALQVMVSLIAGLFASNFPFQQSLLSYSLARGFGEVVGGKSLICLASRVVLLNVYKSPELLALLSPIYKRGFERKVDLSKVKG